MSLRMPAEHGAWRILLVPFACSAVLAGELNLPLLLAGVCAVSFFLWHGSVEAHGGWNSFLEPAHLLLGSAGFSTALLLVVFYRRYSLVWIGLAAVVLYLFQRRLVSTPQVTWKEKRSLAAELVGVVLLTLAAPAAWIAALGWLDTAGLQLWLLNLLFFLDGVLYVKYRVRGVAAHRNFSGLGERFAFAWPVLLYHLMVLAFLACSVLLEVLPLAVILAFLPGALRAHNPSFSPWPKISDPSPGLE